MIPEFDNHGYLPAGIYKSTLKELRKRYAYNALRMRLFQGLEALVYELRASNCATLYVDGSYITNKAEPEDYDAVWELAGVNNTIDSTLRDGTIEQIKRKYFGDVFCRMPEIFGRDHLEFFQTDRTGIAKGIIKIDLRKVE